MSEMPNLTAFRRGLRREVDSFFSPVALTLTAALAVILGLCLMTLVIP